MKYIVGILVVFMLVRIDMVILGVETLSEKLKSKTGGSTPQAEALPQPDNIISIKEDKALGRTPRSEFFSLLDDFHLNPDREVREKLIEVLRKNPTVLGFKLDPVFEGEIFKMADLVYNNSPELPNLLVELTGLLQGENLDMVKRFFTILMDHDLEPFLRAYTRTKDANCIIAGQMGHRVPEEELLNEYIEREDAFKTYLAKEKVDPALQAYAKNCLLILQLQMSKLAPSPAENTEDTANVEQSPSP